MSLQRKVCVNQILLSDSHEPNHLFFRLFWVIFILSSPFLSVFISKIITWVVLWLLTAGGPTESRLYQESPVVERRDTLRSGTFV